MAYRLQLTLENPTTMPVETTIYKGTVFEIADPDARVQNLVATDDTTIIIEAGSTETVDVSTWCMNERFAAPHNTPMRLTSLAVEDDHISQADIWADLAERL